jgi:hypothetical protein
MGRHYAATFSTRSRGSQTNAGRIYHLQQRMLLGKTSAFHVTADMADHITTGDE